MTREEFWMQAYLAALRNGDKMPAAHADTAIDCAVARGFLGPSKLAIIIKAIEANTLDEARAILAAALPPYIKVKT